MYIIKGIKLGSSLNVNIGHFEKGTKADLTGHLRLIGNPLQSRCYVTAPRSQALSLTVLTDFKHVPQTTILLF